MRSTRSTTRPPAGCPAPGGRSFTESRPDPNSKSPINIRNPVAPAHSAARIGARGAAVPPEAPRVPVRQWGGATGCHTPPDRASRGEGSLGHSAAVPSRRIGRRRPSRAGLPRHADSCGNSVRAATGLPPAVVLASRTDRLWRRRAGPPHDHSVGGLTRSATFFSSRLNETRPDPEGCHLKSQPPHGTTAPSTRGPAVSTFIRPVRPSRQQPAPMAGQDWVRPAADHPGSAERHRAASDPAATA